MPVVPWVPRHYVLDSCFAFVIHLCRSLSYLRILGVRIAKPPCQIGSSPRRNHSVLQEFSAILLVLGFPTKAIHDFLLFDVDFLPLWELLLSPGTCSVRLLG